MIMSNMIRTYRGAKLYSRTYLKSDVRKNIHTTTTKPFHNSTVKSQQYGNSREMPKVYYYQNPFQWLRIKWQIMKLQKWDRDFTEKEFIRGSSHAITSVTTIVRNNDLDGLVGLLTPFALSKLRRDILVLWTDDITKHIGLSPADIKLAVPTKVHLRVTRPTAKKLWDIDMWYMAMKWRNLDALLITDIVARFSRDFTYDKYDNSEWTISFFEDSTVSFQQEGNGRDMPNVYYYQNPLHWLTTKLQLMKLQTWNKDFSVEEFNRGSTHAIALVSEIVSYNELDDLEGLLTPLALKRLRQDVLVLWSYKILKNIGLKPVNVKISVPTRVDFRVFPSTTKKICDIDMWFMAMKWQDLDELAMIEIVARLNRDFTNDDSEWTISLFELLKYHIHNYAKENK